MNTQLALQPLVVVSGITTFDGWKLYGKQLRDHDDQLAEHAKSFQLVLGDWANFGVSTWGEQAERAIKEIGYKPETIQNFKWVAARIPDSLRDEGTTLEDYRAVAPLATETERKEWLDKKKAEGWSGRRLREEIKKARAGQQARTDVPPERLTTSRRDALTALVDEFNATGDDLLKRGDELSKAQADVYFDCAAQLKDALKGD